MFGISLTNIARDIGIESAEDHIAVLKLLRAALPHDHVGDVANGRGLLPSHGVLVLLAGGAGRCADGVELERWVALEEEDEALADGASASEDTWRGVKLVLMFERWIGLGQFALTYRTSCEEIALTL